MATGERSNSDTNLLNSWIGLLYGGGVCGLCFRGFGVGFCFRGFGAGLVVFDCTAVCFTGTGETWELGPVIIKIIIFMCCMHTLLHVQTLLIVILHAEG